MNAMTLIDCLYNNSLLGYANGLNVPATGDESNLWIWIAVLAISCIALVTFIPLADKKNYKPKK